MKIERHGSILVTIAQKIAHVNAKERKTKVTTKEGTEAGDAAVLVFFFFFFCTILNVKESRNKNKRKKVEM
jgi:hypothetical protein